MNKVFLDITKECNGNCIYCYTESGIKKNRELNTLEIKKLINDLVNAKVSSLSIAGGEPFMRNDLLDILLYASGKIKCSLTKYC